MHDDTFINWTIECGDGLWVCVEYAELDNDGLFMVRDSVGGEVLVDASEQEVDKLIDALKQVKAEYEKRAAVSGRTTAESETDTEGNS